MMYYRFLHPKSTEISLGLRQRAHMGRECLQQGDSSFSLGDKSLPPAPSSHPLSRLLILPSPSLGSPALFWSIPGAVAWSRTESVATITGCSSASPWKLVTRFKINRAYGAGACPGYWWWIGRERSWRTGACPHQKAGTIRWRRCPTAGRSLRAWVKPEKKTTRTTASKWRAR